MNYFYDTAGRTIAEDFSPCLDSQAAYSAPDLATGDGTEAFYWYDAPDPAAPATIDDCAPNPLLLRGRLASASDRASKLITAYDGRGRIACVARQIAKPGAPSDVLTTRYAPRFYTRTTTYDAADREVEATTGARQVLPSELSRSAVQTTYSKRGVVAKVGSTYGALVSRVTHDADGLTRETRFADPASTTTMLDYDVRRRLKSIQSYRGTPPIWSATPPAYSPAPSLYDPPSSLQLLLQDYDISYDIVDNPTDIVDHRLDWEWPTGASPVSRHVEYDDLYRVTQVDYTYSGTNDWVSPYAAEDAGETSDNRQATPSPHVSFDKRMARQTLAYDWLGNTTHTDDDAKGFYDRSLGTVTNGTAVGKPYQLKSASNEASGSARAGRVDAAYDDDGNMTGLVVKRSGPCLPTGASCSQRFVYDWDEVSRLVRARRWDLSASEALTATPGGEPPATEPAVDLRYAYDADDSRVLKTAADTTAGVSLDDSARAGRHTVYVFGSLDLRGALWTGDAGQEDFEHTVWTEVPYLTVGGTRLGRVHYDNAGLPASSFVEARVFLELPDHLGSTSIVFDRETSELVEAGTYSAQGTVESDYRPSRWKSFREDYRFSGKEEDIEVGLTYFGKRYLHAYLGRWMSPDPLALHSADDGDLNVYAYVHGRYFASVDEIGLDGFFRAVWNSAKKADFGSSSAFGQYVSHADYFGSSVVQSDEKLSKIQTGAAVVTVAAATIATGGLAAEGFVAVAGTGSAATLGAGGVGAVVGGATSRGLQKTLVEGKSASEGLRAATDVKAVAKDAVIGVATAGVGLAAQRVLPRVMQAAKAKVSSPKGPACNGGTCGGPGVCFTAGTPVAVERGEVPIEQIRLGARVSAGNSRCSEEHLSPETRTIALTIPNPAQPLDLIQVRIARPLSWLAERGLHDGVAWLDLDEVGVSGWATVTAIEPGPVEEAGSGCLVLMTVEHVASEVLRLRLSGGETLELTPTHRLYVEGRTWTAARDLRLGARLRTDFGTVAVEAIEVGAPNQRVYNLEVGLEHAYRVARSHLWAHNQCPAKGGLPRFDGPKPKYHVNEAHVPGSGKFNPDKTPLPKDAEAVFKKAVPDAPTGAKNWFGMNSDGKIYRFSGSSDGTAHYSGTEGVGKGIRNLTDYAKQRLGR